MSHNIIAHNVSRETLLKFKKLYNDHESVFNDYIDNLLWWNKRINIVSRLLNKMDIQKHVFHSILLSCIPSFLSHSTFIDAGTGGGLPGIPLAILYPNKFFFLNDSNHKKIIATEQIYKYLNLKNVNTISSPVSNIKPSTSQFVIISKHAFKINELLDLTSSLHWSELYLLKGIPFESELKGIKMDYTLNYYKLDNEFMEPFFHNKCLISIKKNLSS